MPEEGLELDRVLYLTAIIMAGLRHGELIALRFPDERGIPASSRV
jgi:integrase